MPYFKQLKSQGCWRSTMASLRSPGDRRRSRTVTRVTRSNPGQKAGWGWLRFSRLRRLETWCPQLSRLQNACFWLFLWYCATCHLTSPQAQCFLENLCDVVFTRDKPLAKQRYVWFLGPHLPHLVLDFDSHRRTSKYPIPAAHISDRSSSSEFAKHVKTGKWWVKNIRNPSLPNQSWYASVHYLCGS